MPPKKADAQDTADVSQLRLSFADESFVASLLATATESSVSLDRTTRTSDVVYRQQRSQQQQQQSQEQASGGGDIMACSAAHLRANRKESIASSIASVTSTSGPLTDAPLPEDVVVVASKDHDIYSSRLLSHDASLHITSSIANALNMDDYWTNLSSQITVDWYAVVICYCAAHDFSALKTQHLLNWLCRFRQLVERRCEGAAVSSPTAQQSNTFSRSDMHELGQSKLQVGNMPSLADTMTAAKDTTPSTEQKDATILDTSHMAANESAHAQRPELAVTTASNDTEVVLSEFDYVATLHDALQSFVHEELEKNDCWTRLTREYSGRVAAGASASAAALSGNSGTVSHGSAVSSNGNSASASNSAAAAAANRAGERIRGGGGGVLGEKLSKQQLQQQMREELEEEQRRQSIMAALPPENIYLDEKDVADFVNTMVMRDLLQHAALYRYAVHHSRVSPRTFDGASSSNNTNDDSVHDTTNYYCHTYTGVDHDGNDCTRHGTHDNSGQAQTCREHNFSSPVAPQFVVMVEEAMAVPPLSRATTVERADDGTQQENNSEVAAIAGGSTSEKQHMRRHSNTSQVHANANVHVNSRKAAMHATVYAHNRSPTPSPTHIHSKRTSASMPVLPEQLGADPTSARLCRRISQGNSPDAVAALREMQAAEMCGLVNCYRATVALEQQRAKASEDEKALQLHFANEGVKRAAEDVYHGLEQNVSARQLRVIQRIEALERSLGIVDSAALLMSSDDGTMNSHVIADDNALGHGGGGNRSGKKGKAVARN